MASRRDFLKISATAAAFTMVPRNVLGGAGVTAPSGRINIGCIGVGAQGTRVMMDFLREKDVRVVAVCDVNRQSGDYSEWAPNELRDKVRALLSAPTWGSDHPGAGKDSLSATAGREPARQIVDGYYSRTATSGSVASKGDPCAVYSDYREMLAKQHDLDAVVICTPDHWHSTIAIAAMNAKKHVYCQKPMAHSVAEVREMAAVARRTSVATQIAIPNSADESTFELEEWIAAGVIGPVRRVENWSTRPFWPQGIERPKESQPVPAGLDWNMWLGPAPERPFHHIYQPFNWRGWYDFGNGALGDMGEYSFDTIFRALKLAAPTSIDSSSTKIFAETFPAASMVHFGFAARGDMPPVMVNWYDGDLKPARPTELEDGREMGFEGEGLIFAGDQGSIMCSFNGGNPKLIPESRMSAFHPPPKTLPRSAGHYREFIEACKGGPKPAANFEFEAPIAEALMLGNISLRTQQALRWDAASKALAGPAAATALLGPTHRSGW